VHLGSFLKGSRSRWRPVLVWYRALVDFLHVLMKSTKFRSRFQQKYGDLSKKKWDFTKKDLILMGMP
jgi:hypothetical protein